jgi:hypothetical protein
VKHTTLARVGIAGIAIVLSLTLAGCRSGDSSTTGAAGTTGAPSIQGGDEFCNIAVAALASAGDVTKASNDLTKAMTGNDVNALHAASQAILDNSAQATHFYSLGASAASDQATKDAFNGLSQFVAQYSVPMGQAGVNAASVPAFVSSITRLFSDPTLKPLLTNAATWAQATSTFTKQHCAIT